MLRSQEQAKAKVVEKILRLEERIRNSELYRKLGELSEVMSKYMDVIAEKCISGKDVESDVKNLVDVATKVMLNALRSDPRGDDIVSYTSWYYSTLGTLHKVLLTSCKDKISDLDIAMPIEEAKSRIKEVLERAKRELTAKAYKCRTC